MSTSLLVLLAGVSSSTVASSTVTTYLAEVDLGVAFNSVSSMIDVARGDAEVSLNLHPFGRVRDDDSPRSFQAFLQHNSTVLLAARGSILYSNIQEASLTQRIGTIAMAADLYLDRRLAVVGAFEFGRLGESSNQGTVNIGTSSITGSHNGASIGFGFHPGTTRVDVGFRWVGERTSIALVPLPLNAPAVFVVRDVGGYAALRTVIDGTLMLTADADLFTQGGHGAIGAEYALDESLSFGGGLSYLRITRDSGVSITSEVAAALFVSWWPDSAWRVRVEYRPMRSTSSETDLVTTTHTLRLTAGIRF